MRKTTLPLIPQIPQSFLSLSLSINFLARHYQRFIAHHYKTQSKSFPISLHSEEIKTQTEFNLKTDQMANYSFAQNAFNAADSNKNGSLDFKEFQSLLGL